MRAREVQKNVALKESARQGGDKKSSSGKTIRTDLLIQQVGCLDLQIKDAGPRLVSNEEQITEAACDGKGGALALPL